MDTTLAQLLNHIYTKETELRQAAQEIETLRAKVTELQAALTAGSAAVTEALDREAKKPK